MNPSADDDYRAVRADDDDTEHNREDTSDDGRDDGYFDIAHQSVALTLVRARILGVVQEAIHGARYPQFISGWPW